MYAPSRRTDTDAGRPFSREKDLALSELTHTQPKLIVWGRTEEERRGEWGTGEANKKGQTIRSSERV
jgi:hypothetical protein